MKKVYLGILFVVMLTSCNMGESYYVNFDEIESVPGMFRVVEQRYTDMEELVTNGGLKTM